MDGMASLFDGQIDLERKRGVEGTPPAWAALCV